jgi:hypothetical protein
MKRVTIAAVGLALAVALPAAAVFAIWPAVGGAPWLESGRAQLPTSEMPLLPISEVVNAVTWQVAFWCNDTYSSSGDYTRDECKQDRILGTCADKANWVLTYHADRQVWDASCNGFRYLVDDNTGNVSSPTTPGLSGIDRLERRLHDLGGRVGDVGSRVDGLESRVGDLEWQLE